jgi:signal peptidase I
MRELGLGGQDFAALAGEILGRGEALRFRAKGASMRPFIRDGDLVEVRPIGATSVRRGDVVLFRAEGGRALAHRVVRVVGDDRREALVTKGDSITWCDGPISREQVLGRVVAVERDGRRIGLGGGLQRIVGLLWMGLWPVVRRLRSAARVVRRWTRQGSSETSGSGAVSGGCL